MIKNNGFESPTIHFRLFYRFREIEVFTDFLLEIAAQIYICLLLSKRPFVFRKKILVMTDALLFMLNKLINNMNSILRFFVPFAFFLILMSCEVDPCEGVSCDNGVCDPVSGDCICSRGYQTDSDGICTIQWTTKFIGTYAVSDSCTGPNVGTTTYNAAISAVDEINLSLSNFGNTGRAVPAMHTNSVNFEIDWTSNDTVFSGTGVLVDTFVRINYMVNDTTNHRIDTCTAIYTRM